MRVDVRQVSVMISRSVLHNTHLSGNDYRYTSFILLMSFNILVSLFS